MTDPYNSADNDKQPLVVELEDVKDLTETQRIRRAIELNRTGVRPALEMGNDD